jgi:hypothetical protein
VAHAPTKTARQLSARLRQAAQHRVQMAYAYAPLMLAHDRQILEVPLEERLKRTSALRAWAKTCYPLLPNPRRQYSNKSRSSRHPQLFLPSNTSLRVTLRLTPPVPCPARPNATMCRKSSVIHCSFTGFIIFLRRKVCQEIRHLSSRIHLADCTPRLHY